MMQEVVIWSKENCAQCDKAKSLLRANNVSYEERKIGAQWTREQLLEAVPTARSVPQIFISGEHVGGYAELAQRFQ
jgi:glutaredoxin 3